MPGKTRNGVIVWIYIKSCSSYHVQGWFCCAFWAIFWPVLEKNTNSISGSNIAKYASKTRFSKESGPGGLYREHESMQMNKRKSLKNQAETDNPVVWFFRGNSNKYGLLLFYLHIPFCHISVLSSESSKYDDALIFLIDCICMNICYFQPGVANLSKI